jgi:hypothetical protein
MNLYLVLLAVHVIVAVLGVGLLAAIPVTAASARRAKLALSSVGALDPTVAVIVVLMEVKPFQ